MRRHPVDTLIFFEHLLFNLLDVDEPRSNRVIDKRVPQR
jgi:hypothetical protein